MLAQQYTVNKAITVTAKRDDIASLVTDLNQWPQWQPWEAVDPSIQFTIAEPSQGVGAHQFWDSRWGAGEMTITQMNDEGMSFNILFNQEHIARGSIRYLNQGNDVEIICTLHGEVNTPIIGGYLALLSQYILNNTVKLALNNIKTHAQLTTTNKANATDDSQNGTSKS
tara:strand:+ start:9744 stop:10250 length:507 start_codon:yes stop_codon:yes gene_type:complete